MGSWILKSLLLKLLVVLIQNHADGGSIVRYLPGFEGPLPFQLETGYIPLHLHISLINCMTLSLEFDHLGT